MRDLPDNYFIIDGDETPHDGDETDGRFGLYAGDPEVDGEFLGNLHDREKVVELAWEHAGGILTPEDDEAD